LNFDFNRHSSKSEILDAINNLPMINGSGSATAAAMKLLGDGVFPSCPLRSRSQCVALVISDSKSDDKAAIMDVEQVRETNCSHQQIDISKAYIGLLLRCSA
jgi:von Willebrand factor type A domain